ncbi:endonuclease/exonuclease/phosphatase family protein [Roseomonas sp. GC11]|uniref:endonuclease/exonuclease/phosphatase family protein n=1 Tax=Roseomonas sp. GC11 TaxID=2950546 RepID=UPI00210D54C0|nr:endonuclease/exonuclease/phosphatase family protein [Roseomonas sp. GC11]MCQ4159160.1 endonuclease/exonuclease/phosphatase family protein [Roseomonas sp. GC11]
MILRAMTWNIHAGIGGDGRYDLERVLRLIRRHGPDILAVQEIDSRSPGRLPCPFAALRAEFGGHALVAETLRGHGGAYGHMLLSRWPLHAAARHDLSVPGREPRAALAARLETPAGGLGLVAAHLGLCWRERARQARRLATLARAMPGPLVVLGDFNDWSWRGPVWRALAPLLPGRTALRSFPARRPLLRLDEIFCRPATLLSASWRDPAAALASDHLPVLAELDLARLAENSPRHGRDN